MKKTFLFIIVCFLCVVCFGQRLAAQSIDPIHSRLKFVELNINNLTKKLNIIYTPLIFWGGFKCISLLPKEQEMPVWQKQKTLRIEEVLRYF
jgi:hypothetical protein